MMVGTVYSQIKKQNTKVQNKAFNKKQRREQS